MRVVAFTEPNERFEGLRKYKVVPRNIAFFFPNVFTSMTTEGMHEGIKIYILNESLDIVFNQVVNPGRVITLRGGIDRHAVETSLDTPWINNFEFLKEYV
jgi:hypothetical protein